MKKLIYLITTILLLTTVQAHSNCAFTMILKPEWEQPVIPEYWGVSGTQNSLVRTNLITEDCTTKNFPEFAECKRQALQQVSWQQPHAWIVYN